MDPAKVEADDFFSSGMHLPGNTSNPMGAAFKAVTVNQMPGLNTLGIVIARLDFERKGFLPPHFHARATEILTVLKGSMEVGFVTSNPSFRYFKKVLQKGDVFVVPAGLVHYQRNVGAGKIVAIAALNSQNPGITALPNAVFGANPDIDSGFLARAFALDKKTVKELQRKF